MKKLRAILRATVGVAALPVFLGLTALQGSVIGPVFKNHTAIPNMLYNGLRRLFGYKIVFNKASAPIEKGRPVWFVANHMSISDFIVMGSKFNGTFVGKGDILKWPVIAQMAKAIKFIGVRRSREFNDQSRGQIIENFNQGHNTIMFPEGTTSEGKQVYQFRAALPELLFGQNGKTKTGEEIALQTEVVVQPVAITVKSINGESAKGNDTLRNLYSLAENDNTLSRIWQRLQIRRTEIELTVFEPLKPSDFVDSKEIMNKAALDIVSAVNPGQVGFEKIAIPSAAPKQVKA